MSIATDSASAAGWQGLFWTAFRQSRNAMALIDDQRRLVDVNGPWLKLLGYDRPSLIGRPIYELRTHGPAASNREWKAALQKRQFTGIAELVRADDSTVHIEFAGHPEVVTGKQLVLVVALRSDRMQRVRAHGPHAGVRGPLSGRELEVVRWIALGLSGPEIATELQLAHNTVRSHVRNAMAKTGSRSRAHLVAMVLADPSYWSKRS